MVRQEKVKRNLNIYLDKEAGMSWTQLIHKYKLSYTTLRFIYLREKAKRGETTPSRQ